MQLKPEIHFVNLDNMTSSQITELMQMVNEVYAQGEEGLLQKWVQRITEPELIEMIKNEEVAVLFLSQRMIGCVHLTEHDEESFKFGMLAVHGDFRGRGYGKLLIHFAEKVARERRYKKMALKVLTPKNWIQEHKKFLQYFYTSLGYEPAYPEVIDFEDELITECNLTVYKKDL